MKKSLIYRFLFILFIIFSWVYSVYPLKNQDFFISLEKEVIKNFNKKRVKNEKDYLDTKKLYEEIKKEDEKKYTEFYGTKKERSLYFLKLENKLARIKKKYYSVISKEQEKDFFTCLKKSKKRIL